MDSYDKVLEIVGDISANTIAPNAEWMPRGTNLKMAGFIMPMVLKKPGCHSAGRPDGDHASS